MKNFLKIAVKTLCLGSLFFMTCAWANEAVEIKPGAALLKTAIGLVVVIGLIFILAWFSRRLGGHAFGNARFMKVVAVQALGAREKIVLVDVGGQQMMLGVAPGRISTLHVFSEPVVPVIDEKNTSPFAARSTSDFSKKLQEFLTQGKKS